MGPVLKFNSMATLPPAGDATPEQELVRWSILVALSLIALAVGYLVTSPRYRFLSDKITPRMLLFAPRAGMFVGISTILISVGLAPFSNDVYSGVICPCHWTESFHEQYTTMSILVAYSPMKYVIWIGFNTVAFLAMITAFIGIHRWWNNPVFNSTGRKAVLSIWLVLMFMLAFSISADLMFSRHFDRPLHITLGYAFFVSTALGALFGHPLVRWETISRREKSLPISEIGQRWSLIAMSICFFLSLWYLDLYELRIVSPTIFPNKTEGILAFSEHLLISSQLIWMGSLSHVFLAGSDEEE